MDQLDCTTERSFGSSESLDVGGQPGELSLLSGDGRRERVQGCQGCCNIWEEPVKKVNTAQETLQLHFGIGPGHGQDCLDLGWLRNNSGGVDNVAEVFDLAGSQGTLLPIDAEASLVEASEDFVKVNKVLVEGRAGDQNVVQVNKNSIHITQNTIHKPLKSLSAVFEAKRHPQKLK